MEKPIVGQVVYSLNIGNAARHCEQKLTEMAVIKVGRKYFTCLEKGKPEFFSVQFRLDTWTEKTEYTSDHSLYRSPQEWEDEKESNLICQKLKDSFEYGHNRKGVSLKNLRLIEELLSNPEESDAFQVNREQQQRRGK